MTTRSPDTVIDDVTAEREAVAAAIAIPAMVVQSKGHGHAGTAMALAPLAHVLYTRVLRHNPSNPNWPGRDRLVLSAGHASLLLYVQLFFTGYGLTLDDLAASRKLGSLTPGHPERGHTAGIDMSTGPLGQGVASAVGMALAARREAAMYEAAAHELAHTVFVIAGDGCLEEGVSGEASSFAGTQGLDNLVLIWDDNEITIDGRTSETFSEDVRARYRAYGWRVLEVETPGNLDALENVLAEAISTVGRPTLIALKTVIGAPSATFGGTAAAHSGGFGDPEVVAIKTSLGFAPDASLDTLVTQAALAFSRRAIARGEAAESAWQQALESWSASNMRAAAHRTALLSNDSSAALGALSQVTVAAEGTMVATRKTNGAVLEALSSTGTLWGGSADLAGSTNVAVPGSAVSSSNPAGEFIRFGIREHAMAAIVSGIALHGLWRGFGSTYLVFSDYLRPSIRLASLMKLPTLYIFTHDSVAVGEDGPTHQPVEQIASLRTVPGLTVVRPADSAEVVSMWKKLLSEPAGPTAIILSRQDVPVLPPRDGLDESVAQGGYVAWQSGDGMQLALIATGSEVWLAVEAAQMLAAEGIHSRVISMPSVEWFGAAPAEYRESVLPASLTARVTIEAGRGDAWWRFAGTTGEVISIEEFGESGSGAELLALRGITSDNIVAAAHRTIARNHK